MNLDKHTKQEKYIRKIEEEISRLRNEQRNLGYVQLDEKQFIGYEAYLVPRQDIQNRNDAEIFWNMANHASTAFAKRIDKFSWNDKGWRNHWIQSKPMIRSISTEAFKLLSDKVKSYYQFVSKGNGWHSKDEYINIVPTYYFEIKYRKVYRTQIKVESVLIEQELAELENYLISNNYYDLYGCSTAPKHYRKMLNVSRRRFNKQKVKLLESNQDIDINFDNNYKDASWYW